MHHLFFWHLPIDQRLPYLLSKQYGPWRGYPLTYTAQVASRMMSEESRFSCGLALVDASSSQTLLRSSRDQTDRFFDFARASEYQDVMAGETDAVQHVLYYVAYFRLLCRRIVERYGPGSFVQYPFIAGSSVPGSLLKIQRCLDLVIDEMNGFTGIGKRDRLAIRFDHVASQTLRSSLWETIGVNGPISTDGRSENVDVLVLAMEESDRRSQARLVRRLARCDLSMKWCRVDGSRMALSKDEEELEPDGSDDALVHPLPQDMAEGYRWRWSALSSWWQAGLRYQICDCINHAGVADWSPLLRWRVAASIAGRKATRPLMRKAVRNLLRTYQPRLVVMSSAYGMMATAQAEIVKQNIPMVRLPHGVENVLNPWPNWRGRAVGRFGRAEVELLKERDPLHDDRFHSIGSYHLGVQALKDSDAYANAWPAGQVQVLYPVSYFLLTYPDTQLEIEMDLLAMGDAARAVDAELTVRCHPRQRNWDYFDYVLMQQHYGERAHWTLSDGSTSLVQAMQASHIMILRTWSGSALQAMYANRPLIAWMPRPGQEFADRILSRLPCRATTGAELEALLRRLIEEPDYRAEVVRQQHELLEQLVENPYGDPYAGAEKLVLETLERVKSEG